MRSIAIICSIFIAACASPVVPRLKQQFDSKSSSLELVNAADVMVYGRIEGNLASNERALLMDPLGEFGLRKIAIALRPIYSYPSKDFNGLLKFDFWELHGTPYSGSAVPERLVPGEIRIVLLRRANSEYRPVRHAWRSSLEVLDARNVTKEPIKSNLSRSEWITWMTLVPPLQQSFESLRQNFEILCDNTKRTFGPRSLAWLEDESNPLLSTNVEFRRALKSCIAGKF